MASQTIPVKDGVLRSFSEGGRDQDENHSQKGYYLSGESISSESYIREGIYQRETVRLPFEERALYRLRATFESLQARLYY